MKRRQSKRAIFAVPTVIAAVSLFGLVAALTGDGLRDMASWVGLAVPAAAVAWARHRAGPSEPDSAQRRATRKKGTLS
ncbi:hypothetical protein [Sphingomonas flavalba]|uniref:hypothetical protein n=1 Tax=Sphingomonas flavalba TaxID=2559804 RepID=UPI00109DFFAD|nr:hypothetical protein [Sphingomonas flavalba]